MSHANPLENFFDSEDFEEVAESEKSSSEEDDHDSHEMSNDISEFNKNLFDVELFDPVEISAASDDMEEPRLPENGLRTRTRFMVHQQVCNGDKSNM